MKNAEPTLPKNITISHIVGEMQVGQAEIKYSHCAERQRRHFQEAVYKTYERAMALGTLIEENIKLKPRTGTKKCPKTISKGLEGDCFSMKNAGPIQSELMAREGGGGGATS